MIKQLLAILALGLPISNSHSAGYDTLPKGVNTFVFKQVVTSEIKNHFNENKREETLNLKDEFTSSRLQDISTIIRSYFDELKTLSAEAYDNFSLGEFEADVTANVTAQGFGYGHGITERLSIYSSIPVYHIKTSIDFNQTKPSNLAAVQATIRNAPTPTALAKFVRDLTLQLPQTNQELLQSLVVNFYGYRPIGRWEKDALGDAEIGLIYRLTDYSDKGVAVSTGAVLPTGDEDDPDSLQDVSTGDGQYDAFIAAMAGISFFDNMLQIDIKGRYTHQFASNKEVRWIEDSELPLARTKRSVNQKLGNKIDSTLALTIVPTIWMNLSGALILSSTSKTTYYDITDKNVRNALEKNTDSSSRWARVGLGFSTVEAYKRKKFDLPLDIGISAQKLINAKNSPSYERYDVDFKLYF
jgi:hypothetical protein